MEEIRPADDWTTKDVKTVAAIWAKIAVEDVENVAIIIQPVTELQARIGLPIIHTFGTPDTVLWLLGQILGAAGAAVIVKPSEIPRTQCPEGHELDTDGIHKSINELMSHGGDLIC